MKRAAIYTRVSLDRDGTKASPETQEAECRAHCEARGWDVVAVYCDRNKSAFKPRVKRAEFDEMMAAVDRREVDVLIAYKIDRLTRGGFTGIASIVERVERAGAVLAFVHDPVDTSTPMGQAVLGVIASVARQESENTALRVRSAAARAARRGEMPGGGSRQFGHRRDPDDGRFLGIDDVEADIVREVADRILAGESLRRIAFDLNDRRIRTPRHKQWTSQTLGQMIRSPRLAALRLHNGTLHKGKWEAILSEEQHLAVMAALDRPYVHRAVRRHLLSGLAKCALCGGSLKTMGFRMKNGKPFPRYQCVKQPGQPNCGKVAAAKASMERVVVAELLDFLAEGWLVPIEDGQRVASELESAIADDENALVDLARARFLDRSIADREYGMVRDEIEHRLATSRTALEASRQQAEAAGALRRGSRDDLQRWWEQEASFEEQRAALEAAVSRIDLHPAKHRGGNRFDADRVQVRWRWDLFVTAAEAFEEHAPEDERRRAAEEAYELEQMVEAGAGHADGSRASPVSSRVPTA